MSDAIDDLYAEIEKAKGLLPRGGSKKLRNQLWNKREKMARELGFDGAKGRRIGRVTRYLAGRHKNNWASAAPVSGEKGQYLIRRGKYK